MRPDVPEPDAVRRSESSRARETSSGWMRTSATALFVPLLVFAAACAGAQEPPAGDPAPQDEVRPPDPTVAPSIRYEWVEERVRVVDPDGGSIVTVSAGGRVEAEPDRARIHFAVESEAQTASAAGEENARTMTEVTRALREAGSGVPGFTVETAGFSLMPQYGPVRDGRREIVGYVARNSVQVVADDVAAAGPLIDAAIGAGANRVAGLQFELSDPEPHRHRAVTEAIRVGRAEAEVAAQALGMELGPIVAVEGGAERPSPRFVQMDAAARVEIAPTAAPTPIEAGSQTVSANVTLRFRLVEAR